MSMSAASAICSSRQRTAWSIGAEEAAPRSTAEKALVDVGNEHARIEETLTVGRLQITADVIHRAEVDQVAEREGAHRGGA